MHLNKYFLISAFIISSAFAKAKVEKPVQSFKGVLEYSTNLDFKERFSVERDKDGIKVNGNLLSSSEVLLKSNALGPLLRIRKNTAEVKCPPGKYVYKFIQGKTEKTEEGCVGTPRFTELHLSFKVLLK